MDKPIRVLHVFGKMDRGGAETMIMNLYRNIDRSMIQFDFVVHTKEKCAFDDEIISLGGLIYSVPQYNGRNHFQYIKVWKKFIEQHIEYRIIHGHVRSTASIYLNVAKAYGLVIIAHSHSIASRGNKFEQIVKNILQLPIRNVADNLFSCSSEAGKWLFGKNMIKNKKHNIVKNAINIDQFVFNEDKRNEIRKLLNIEDKFVVGHVGSFSYPKNHKFLLDIFSEVQKRVKESVLLLVGDGELKKSIDSKINQLKLSNNVLMIGVRSDISELLQAMDVFLFPSLFEGLGIAVVEAQAAGLHTVVSEAIPEEACVTDLIEKEFLNSPISKWVDKILKYAYGYERKDTSKIIKSKGYDVRETAKWLQNFYLFEHEKITKL